MNSGYSRKNRKHRAQKHEFSRGIEEETCRNSGGQLKKKWNTQGCLRKNHVEYP